MSYRILIDVLLVFFHLEGVSPFRVRSPRYCPCRSSCAPKTRACHELLIVCVLKPSLHGRGGSRLQHFGEAQEAVIMPLWSSFGPTKNWSILFVLQHVSRVKYQPPFRRRSSHTRCLDVAWFWSPNNNGDMRLHHGYISLRRLYAVAFHFLSFSSFREAGRGCDSSGGGETASTLRVSHILLPSPLGRG